MASMMLPQASPRGFNATAAMLQKDRVDQLGMSPRMPTSPSMPRPASSEPSPRQQTAASSSAYFPPQKRPTTARSQPELLSKLLFFVRHELQQLTGTPGTDQHIRERLHVFRRALGHFASSFGAYAPLLLAIQQAYEDALARSEIQASGIEHMSERLELVQGEASQLLLHRHEQLNTASEEMEAAMQARERAMQGTQRQLRVTNLELAAAKTELKRAQRFCSDAEGRCASYPWQRSPGALTLLALTLLASSHASHASPTLAHPRTHSHLYLFTASFTLACIPTPLLSHSCPTHPATTSTTFTLTLSCAPRPRPRPSPPPPPFTSTSTSTSTLTRCADLVAQLEHWQSEATDARRLASEEVAGEGEGQGGGQGEG